MPRKETSKSVIILNRDREWTVSQPTAPSDRDHPESPPPLTPIQRRPHPAMDAQIAPPPPAATGQRSRPAAKPTSAGSPPPLAPIRQQINIGDDGTPLLAAVDLPIQPATTISTEPPAVVLLEPTPLVEAATGSPSSPRISPTWCEGLSLEDMMAAILAEDEAPTPFCLGDFQAEATLPGRGRNPSPPATGAPDESMAALRIGDLAVPLANNGLMVITLASDVPAAVGPHHLGLRRPGRLADCRADGRRNTPVAVPGTLGAVYEDISEEEIMELSSGEDEEPDPAQDAIIISDEEDNAGETTVNPRDNPNGNIARPMGASPAAAAATGTTNATPLGDARVTGIAAGGPPAVTLDTTLTRAGGSSHGNHIIRVTTGQGNYTAPTTRPDPAINADAGTAVNTPGTVPPYQGHPPRSGQPDARAWHSWRSYWPLQRGPQRPLPPADEPAEPPRGCCRQPQPAYLRRGDADRVTAGYTVATSRPIQRVRPLPATDEYRWRFRRAPADRDPDAPTDDRPGILRNAGRQRRAPWPKEEPSSEEEASTDSRTRARAGELGARSSRLDNAGRMAPRRAHRAEVGDMTYRVQISRGGDRITILPHPRGRDGL
nr:proline-rich protein 36-like [Drosophila kikkawai]